MRILSGWLQKDLFDLLDNREARACCQIMFECFNAGRWTFNQGFNATVGHILYVANHLVASGRALGKESITHSLNFATYQKLSRDSSGHLSPIHPWTISSGEC